MNRFIVAGITFVLLAVGVAGGCSSEDESAGLCSVGALGCPCAAGDVCNGSASCIDGFCLQGASGDAAVEADPDGGCSAETRLCEALGTWCSWGVANDYFEAEDSTIDSCVAGYDATCREFPESETCTAWVYCWVDCVTEQGTAPTDVDDCICERGCANCE